MNTQELKYSKKFIIPADFTFATKIPDFENLEVLKNSSTESNGVRTDYFEFDNGFKLLMSSGPTEISVKSNVNFKETQSNENKTFKIQFDKV